MVVCIVLKKNQLGSSNFDFDQYLREILGSGDGLDGFNLVDLDLESFPDLAQPASKENDRQDTQQDGLLVLDLGAVKSDQIPTSSNANSAAA